VRPGQPEYFKKELWERKKNWQPVWKKLRQEITDVGGANFEELRRLASSTDAAELSAEAEADWASFWTKSVSELPIDLLPALENNCRIDLIDFIGV
jgi:hypothetical protein